jgi:hypothetical protein
MKRSGVTMQTFKKCSCCEIPWFTRDEFLNDGNLKIIGYQANFSRLELGYFLYNHLTCQSTIAIPAALFKDLYEGPIFSERLTGSEPCPGYCLDKEILEPCVARCECAYVREILQILRDWPKEVHQVTKIAQAQ